MEQPLGLTRSTRGIDACCAVVPWRDFADRAGWDALASGAAEPNPFAERWCLEAGLAAFDRRDGVRLAAVTADGTLVGVLPLARRLSYAGRPLPHLGNWMHANAFCGAPLAAAGLEHAFWRALLRWADRHAGRALFLHLQGLPADGPLFAALRDVCAVEQRPAAVVQRLDRALLASDLAPQDYYDAALSGKKRKELRRQHARLAEQGDLSFDRQTGPDGLDAWTDAFLALERAGWKGRENSALACDPATAAFFRQSLAGAAGRGRLERLTLALDGAPIAKLANFISPPGAYSFKTTYDERYARFSPGVLLQRENLALLARQDIAWADSCAAADHPMIERIWREKRPVVRVSIAIGGPLRRAAAAAIFRAELRRPAEGL
ncbi:GNAT family N-acetyltransferase [Altererythrobacter sp. TH136]|uniref:GNAT family N-acetyltransferase n=1 Tax=Altererythrobacter sp. TH136 TaxID=2067415 RepID=UPI001FF015CB|nr:GNAT family N-acetyltransferase [Altererythrobacter sp. TH136]